MKSSRDNLVDQITTYALLGAGAIGVVAGFVDAIFGLDKIQFVKSPKDLVMLFTTSFLAVGLGLERRKNLRDIEDKIIHLGKILDLVKSDTSGFSSLMKREILSAFDIVSQSSKLPVVNFSVMYGTRQIFNEIASIIQSLHENDEIISTGFSFHVSPKSNDEGDTAYQNYIETLVNKIKDSKSKNGSIWFELILTIKNNDNLEFTIKDIFLKSGIGNRFLVKHTTIDSPIEVFIAGNHMIIVFSAYHGRNLKQFAIRLSDPEIRKAFNRWYNLVLGDTKYVENPENIDGLENEVIKYSSSYKNKLENHNKQVVQNNPMINSENNDDN